jgi:membrane protein YqaA with SNARE-associated domain
MLKKLISILFYSGSRQVDSFNLRRWFVFYVIYLGLLAAVALVSFGYCEDDASSAGQQVLSYPHKIWLLSLYLFYMSLCCTFFPAPTAWLVLLMASPVVNLVDSQLLLSYISVSEQQGYWIGGLLTVFVVASVGALGTGMANLNEYHVFTFLLRCGKAHKIRETKFYRMAGHWFDVSPFGLMVTFSFLPIPVDMVRWLAITHRYRRDHYFIAAFLGRMLRYGLLAGAATCLKLSWTEILIIQLVLIIIVIIRFVPKILSHHRKNSISGGTSEGICSQRECD